jgi:hypothetical protein
MVGAKAVDYFSIATCEVSEAGSSLSVKGKRSRSLRIKSADTVPQAAECVSEQGKAMCSDIGGTCITERDGYFITTGLCLALGVTGVVIFIIPTARRLQGERFWVNVSLRQKLRYFFCAALPVAKWRIYT